MAKKCSRCRREAPEGFLWCDVCRERRKAAKLRFKARRPEDHKAKNRARAAAHWASGSPAAVAYRERHKPKMAAACQRWVQENPERKALLNELNTLVASGKIVKPANCRDCGLPKKIVGWGIERADDGGIFCQAWVCWKCWYKRRRAAEGRPA